MTKPLAVLALLAIVALAFGCGPRRVPTPRPALVQLFNECKAHKPGNKDWEQLCLLAMITPIEVPAEPTVVQSGPTRTICSRRGRYEHCTSY